MKRSLDSIFSQLSLEDFHRACVRERIIKIILGSSVIRANTKNILSNCLRQLEIDSILEIKNQSEFDIWHEKKLNIVHGSLLSANNIDIGGMHGHAAKILNLFLSHLILYSKYFGGSSTKDIINFLHIPLDSKVFNTLKSCELEYAKSIKSLTKAKYKEIQHSIRTVASTVKIPPIYFDDYAWTKI